MKCPNDTNGDGNCGRQTCKICHPENFPEPVLEDMVEVRDDVPAEKPKPKKPDLED